MPDAPSPRSPATRLLLQPHRFEGLVVAEIVDRPEHLAVTDGYDHAERRFALDAARRATPPDPPEEHHAVISHIADLVRFHLEAVELGAIGVPEPPHALMAVIGALRPLDQPLEHRVPLDFRVCSQQERL